MSDAHFYPIGRPGQPWTNAERQEWRSRQQAQRLYAEDVLRPLEGLSSAFQSVIYGRLPVDPERYPLLALKSVDWDPERPHVLITGGVHGYETSGVHGALRFVLQEAEPWLGRVNLIVAPCVSPWAYEMVQRWNPEAVDPNRSFGNGAAQESLALRAFIAPLREQMLLHVDLHETTDTDASEFRPALAARDGQPLEPLEIPDGFYLVDDSEAPQTAFQSAIIRAVADVTHIAPPDAQGQLIGTRLVAPGVVEYPLRELGLCAGMTQAPFKTTTEVYPDSPRTSPEECIRAQCVAVAAALDFVLSNAPA